jgi:hypothetical protein
MERGIGMTRNGIIAAIFAAALVCAPAFAGTNKTGGNYQILQDAANAGGGAASGGNFVVVSSIGQRSSGGPATGGAFSCAGGLLGSIDTDAPAISISSPAADQSANGAVALVGTAFDRNDVQWTLYIGPGDSPTVWTQVASGSGNRAVAHTFGSWDSSRYAGRYTYKLVAVDSRGNAAQGTVSFSVDYTLSISGTVPAMQWVFIGLPAAPANPDPISIFGNGEYKVFRWNPEAQPDPHTDRYRYPAAIEPGYGFWIKSYGGPMSYTYAAQRIPTSELYSLPVKPGWNQISSPYDSSFNWGGVQVRKAGTVYDLADAAGMGLIHPTFYTYDQGSGAWVPGNSGSAIAPQTGCYVRAYENVDLMFDQSARALSRIVRPTEDLRAEISAAVNNRRDSNNFIGFANIASAEYDILDAEKPPRAMKDVEDGRHISLYFPKSNWAKNPGNYSADFRPTVSRAGQSESWDFVVETNEIGERVELSWESDALPSDKYTFTLVDLATGARINMVEQSVYSYIATGAGMSTARFRIEVVRIGSSSVSKTCSLKSGWNLISVPLEPEVTSALVQLGDKFPLVDIYQYYDGAFYTGAEVDIQAGLGYWAHVAADAELEFSGLPVPEGQSVTTPLAPGWNLIGNPFDAPVPWDDSVAFKCDGTDYSLSEAIAAGYARPGLFEYDGQGYAPASELRPWKGYFINMTRACEAVLSNDGE